MTNFLREWAKYYPSSFIVIPILCAFFGYLILAAAVVGSVIVMATEKMFQEQNSDAHASTEVFGGIPVIVRIEISQLGATDEFDVVFEFAFEGWQG